MACLVLNQAPSFRHWTVEADRDARWVGKVPEDVDFTVVGLLLAAVLGLCAPLYTPEGKYRANPLLREEGLDVFGS